MNWQDIEKITAEVGAAVQGASIPILDFLDEGVSPAHEHVVMRGIVVVRWLPVPKTFSAVRLILRRGKPAYFMQRAEQVRVPKLDAERQPKHAWDAGWRPAGMGRPTGLTSFLVTKQAVELFGEKHILRGLVDATTIAKARLHERLAHLGDVEKKLLDMLHSCKLPSLPDQVVPGDANAPEN